MTKVLNVIYNHLSGQFNMDAELIISSMREIIKITNRYQGQYNTEYLVINYDACEIEYMKMFKKQNILMFCQKCSSTCPVNIRYYILECVLLLLFNLVYCWLMTVYSNWFFISTIALVSNYH